MRIALLQPPVEDFYQTSIRTQPVGLLYLAAVLEKAGHQVCIFDFLSSREKQSIPFPKDFRYLREHYHLGDCSPVRIFKHYYHYGASWEAIEQSIACEPFDVYGITCMFTPFQSQADRLAGIIRRRFPGRPIAAGGTHATSSPERLLLSGLFDFVFQGEGEISFPRWISELQVSGYANAECGVRNAESSNAECGVWNAECNGPFSLSVGPWPPNQSRSKAKGNEPLTTNHYIPHSALRIPHSSLRVPHSALRIPHSNNPQFHQISGERIESLDDLPFPARHLIDLDRYRIDGVRSTMLITSRGCPFRCTFCSVQQTMGHEFRPRSVANLLREIEECVERYDILHFDIEDDNFTFNQRRAEEIMTAVLDRFGEGALRFSAMNGLTATQLSEPLLKRMRQAGFRQVNLSLVASQPQKLRELKRPVSLSGFKQTVEKARDADLECVAYFILGLPGDNRRRMLETLFELAGQPVLVGPSVFYVSPGTELFDALSDRVPENWDLLRSSTFYMESGSSTLLERITVFRLARLVNFLKERLDAGTWEVERNETLAWLREWQVAGRKSQVETGKSRVADRKSQVAELKWWVPDLRIRASALPPGSSPSERPKQTRKSGLETRNSTLETRNPEVETCDLRPSACDLNPRLSSETILGWAVLLLLRQTGRFHATCRRRRDSRLYEFQSLPTCDKTVGEFFEMSQHAQLCGIQTSREAGFDELLGESSTLSTPTEPRASASGHSI